jgi:hypothetical protein
MKTMIYIVVDTNDADYVGRLTDISDIPDEDMASLVKIATIVSKRSGHNWPSNEDEESVSCCYEGELTEDEIDLLCEYLPAAEYGFHTITKLSILQVESEAILICDE